MERRTWDFSGEFRRDKGLLSSLRVQLGDSDYELAERLSGGDATTLFRMQAREGRVELAHRWAETNRGVLGAQFAYRTVDVTGIQAFIPSNEVHQRAVFFFEQLTAGPVTFELGARWEDQDVEAPASGLPHRSFGGLSASGKVVWLPRKNLAFGATLSRSTRPPTVDELYVSGPHLSIFQFEVGDPNLRDEISEGLDISMRMTAGRAAAELSLFANDIEDYIFLTPTGNTIQVDREEVPEHITVQKNARFRGAEARVSLELLHSDNHHLQLEVKGDTVRAEIDPTGEPLPRIPPSRAGLALRYEGPRCWVRLEGVRVAEQDRIALFEPSTDAYTMFHASGGIRIVAGSAVHDVMVGVTNLTDELARNHISPLRAIAPLPGRDISVSYRILF